MTSTFKSGGHQRTLSYDSETKFDRACTYASPAHSPGLEDCGILGESFNEQEI